MSCPGEGLQRGTLKIEQYRSLNGTLLSVENTLKIPKSNSTGRKRLRFERKRFKLRVIWFRYHLLKSLILAQDERWRRA